MLVEIDTCLARPGLVEVTLDMSDRVPVAVEDAIERAEAKRSRAKGKARAQSAERASLRSENRPWYSTLREGRRMVHDWREGRRTTSRGTGFEAPLRDVAEHAA